MIPAEPLPLLTDKVTMIVGASRGIGTAIARVAFQSGAKLAIAARDLDALRALSRDIDPAGERVFPIKLDLADLPSLERAVEATVKRFGRLDVAINNAATSTGRKPFIDTPDDAFASVVDVNLKGMFVAMKHQARAMLAGGGGAIVNTASAMGIIAAPLIPAYVASKHGVVGLTKSAALEFAPLGIRVNAVAPGPFLTEMLQRGPASSPEALQKMIGSIPLGRLGQLEELANAVVWLASDFASYVTGVIMPVDGGMIVP